jgi:hypothetical protein
LENDLMKRTPAILALLAAASLASSVEAIGFFKTITIDDDYSDWADVPVADSDGGDNSSGPDIGITKVANDGQYLYIFNSFPNSLQLPTFLAIDVDSDKLTGFDPFSLGLIGSEVSWQNDFPFTQSAGVFNTGVGMSGEFFGSGAANLTPFGNFAQRELAISLSILFNGSNAPVFADGDFDLLLYTDSGLGADGIPRGLPGDSGLNGDVSAVISYTVVPEPTSIVSLAVAAVATAGLRRRR